MNENKKVPKIRFPEFSGDWEEKKLGEVASHRAGTSIEKYFSEDGEYKVISIGSYGMDSKYVDQNIRVGLNEITKERVVKKGELAMVLNDKTSTGNIIGRVLLVESQNEFIVNQRTEIISPKKFLNSEFAYVTLNNIFRKKVKKAVQGGTQIYVNYTSIEKLTMNFPSLPEQQKIGNFFKKLDESISLQKNKIDNLKLQKKSLLQKMFPKNGETVPEIRFPEFSGEWEEKKFSDFTKLSQGLQISISDRFTESAKGRLFYITNEFLNPNSSKKYYVENPSKSVIVSYDDILMTRTGNTGKVVTDVSGVYHNNFFKVAYDKDNINKEFLYFLLNSNYVQKEIINRAGSSTIPDLNHNSFYKINVKVPALPEQQKIGNFFKKLDTLISLNQQKLENLEKRKKGLLQKMFI